MLDGKSSWSVSRDRRRRAFIPTPSLCRRQLSLSTVCARSTKTRRPVPCLRKRRKLLSEISLSVLKKVLIHCCPALFPHSQCPSGVKVVFGDLIFIRPSLCATRPSASSIFSTWAPVLWASFCWDNSMNIPSSYWTCRHCLAHRRQGLMNIYHH